MAEHESIKFDAVVSELYEPSHDQLIAAGIDLFKQPRFCVTMLLATLGVKNGNGHKLTVEDAQKAIEALDEKQVVPGNINHEGQVCGASHKLWVDGVKLMMTAVYWRSRYIDDDMFARIMANWDEKKLGASWELDWPFSLEADDEDGSMIVRDWDFLRGGFGLMVDKKPADTATQGTAAITASQDELEAASDEGNKPKQTKAKRGKGSTRMRASEDIVRFVNEEVISFLRGIPCPECESTWGTVKKADYEHGVFEIECDPPGKNSEHHRFTVSIVVKPIGSEAAYALVAEDGELADTFLLKPITREVTNMAVTFTEEQQKHIDKLLEDAKAEVKAELEKESETEAQIQKRIDDTVASRLKEENDKAVAAYKEAISKAAKRVDEINAILPFESEEAKLAARDTYASMSEEDFEKVKEDREKDKEIAELKAENEKLKAGDKPDDEAGEKSKDAPGEKPKDESGDKPEGDKGMPSAQLTAGDKGKQATEVAAMKGAAQEMMQW